MSYRALKDWLKGTKPNEDIVDFTELARAESRRCHELSVLRTYHLRTTKLLENYEIYSHLDLLKYLLKEMEDARKELGEEEA